MTATDNKQIIARVLAAAAEGDMRPFADAMHESYVFRPMAASRRGVWAEAYAGKRHAIENFFGPWHAQLAAGLRMAPRLILADGDHVVFEARGEAAMKATGEPYCQNYCQVLRMAEGRILEAREYFDSGLADALFQPVETGG
ncbi:MAG TPA: nuclear transport factor 2 family protein [Caulobacter sp.]|nr:nuclear transport factor 2 family protein [Caulobacter sp.]